MRYKSSVYALLVSAISTSAYAQVAAGSAGQQITPPADQQAQRPAADTGSAQNHDQSRPERPIAQSPGVALEEIVVTAQRRQENLQSTPVAVTAFTAAYLSSHTIETAKDLALTVPSLNVNTSNNRDVDRYQIRGQGTTAGSAPGVVAYFADAPTPTNGGGPGIYYDLDSVQVLNGPQGTLFGRNTTGGAVLFSPKKPTDAYSGYLEGSYGNYNNQEVQGALNMPLIADKLLLRIAGDERSHDGFTTDALTGRKYDDLDYKAFRASLTANITDKLKNELVYSYLDESNSSTATKLYAWNPASASYAYYGAATIKALLAQEQALGPRATELDDPPVYKVFTSGLVDQLTWRPSDALTVKNIFSYYHFRTADGIDIDGSPLRAVNIYSLVNAGETNGATGPVGATDDYTEELQFSGKALDGRLNWILGGYYELDDPSKPNEYETVQTTTAVTASNSEQAETERDKALYIHGVYDLGGLGLKGFHLTAGYRHSWDSLKNYSFGYALTNFPNLALGGKCTTVSGAIYPNCANRAQTSISADTYIVTLDYHFNSTTMLYATASDGFKIGGFNGNVLGTSPYASFQPEHVQSYEVGAKSDYSIFGAKARTDVALFYSDYDNIQRSQGALVNGNITTVTTNAADGYIEGAEIETSIVLSKSFRISASYAYNYGTYTKVAAGVAGGASLLGQQMPYLSRDKISLDPTYYFPVDAIVGKVGATATYTYTSKWRVSDLTYPGVFTGGYGLTDFQIFWNNIYGHPIDAQFYITNAFNVTYRMFNTTTYASEGAESTVYGDPRMFGVKLRWHWD